jgi:hypothetical protein
MLVSLSRRRWYGSRNARSDMSGTAVIVTALLAGAFGAGFGLVVAYMFLSSRKASPGSTEAGAPAPSAPAATRDGGDPAAQAPVAGMGDRAPLPPPPVADEEEEDETIPTTVFRAEDLDLDALIEQAERLKSKG